MKKLFAIMLMPVLLLGCTAEPVMEQVEDVYAPLQPEPAQLRVNIPDNASVLTAAGVGAETLYFCDGYTLTVQTLTGGDLNRSLQLLTGYQRDSLTVLQTLRNGSACYSCAWTSAGEGGDQVGRLVLLDDGAYHYAVTVMAPAETAGDLAQIWDAVLNEVTLGNTEP